MINIFLRLNDLNIFPYLNMFSISKCFRSQVPPEKVESLVQLAYK